MKLFRSVARVEPVVDVPNWELFSRAVVGAHKRVLGNACSCGVYEAQCYVRKMAAHYDVPLPDDYYLAEV